jgi:quercetin dioxygenase-like cupin family protein
MSQPSYVDTHRIAGDLVAVDLPARINELRAQLAGRGRRSETVYKEGGLTAVLIVMEPGNVIPEHRASGTSTVHILEGRVTVSATTLGADLRPGQLVAFAPNVAHNVEARELTALLLTVSVIAEESPHGEASPPRGEPA